MNNFNDNLTDKLFNIAINKNTNNFLSFITFIVAFKYLYNNKFIKAMKYINKIINNLITDIYKIDILRTSIVLIRFFYFFYLKRSIKYHIDPDKKTDDHITINKNSKKHTVISHNMHFSENLKNFRGTFRKFDGSSSSCQKLRFFSSKK